MSVKHKGLVVAIVALLALSIVAGGVVLAQSPLTIPLNAQNDSGESGSAILTDMGNGTVRVDVTIVNAPDGVSQPMHIHEGTCADLNPAPKFPLTSLENGGSTTEISATLETLLASPHAINGHKSAEEASVYVFCGDLVDMAMQGTVTVTVAAETPTLDATVEATGTTAATAEPTTAEATTAATEEATAAATAESAQPTPTAEATASAAAEATPVPTLPTTGGNAPWNGLVLVAIVGVVALLLGVYLRQAGRRV